MSVEQVVEPQWIYTCDYCKKNEQVDSTARMPENWGRISFSASNWLGDRVDISYRDYCYQCMENALFPLKFLKGKNLEEKMWKRNG